MDRAESIGKDGLFSVVPEEISEEVTPEEEENFFRVVNTDLDEEQKARIGAPPRVFSKERSLLAVHWHPEFIPMDLISRRIDTAFPERTEEIIIPTQHNVFMNYPGSPYSGVEMDCYSTGFNQKIQLLIHLKKDKLPRANVLKSMADYTFNYRSSQLFDFMNTLTEPITERIEQAAESTGADENLVRFVRIYVKKLQEIIEKRQGSVAPDMIKNKLVRNFFDTFRPRYGNGLINRAQAFLTAVKKIVKAEFPLQYFYRTSEIIEEARSVGACIVIPHPEQFWPILLADYDVDGLEVWNPESRKYTEFLISVIDKKNCRPGLSDRRLLVFMGDDTHMGEKAKAPLVQDAGKASREIGVQQAWNDLNIRKRLILARMDKSDVISEYKSRLNG